MLINFSDPQEQITPKLVLGSGGNLNSFKLSCMSLLAARMKMIQSKMNGLPGLELSQHFSHYKSLGIFRDTQGQLTPHWTNFELIRDVWMFLLPARMKKINFSDAQGQITLQSVIVSGRNLNPFKLSCKSLLPSRMKMIQSKMKVLE